MKTLRTPHNRLSVVIPLPEGKSYRVNIRDHKATVPDNVAEIMLGYGEAHYSLEANFPNGVEPGTKVLLVRDTGLGDVLLCTPLLREMSHRGAVVDFLCNASNMWIFDNSPYVRKVMPLERDGGSRSSWDVIVDLRNLVENMERAGRRGHRVDLFAESCDIQIHSRHLDYFITDEEIHSGQRYLQGMDLSPAYPSRKTVAFIWTSSHYTRNWSDRSKYEVMRSLSSAGYNSVIIDGARLNLENLPYGCRDLSGRLSLREVASTMKACDAVLSPDTGLFHLAGALDCPTVTYFGPMAIEDRETHKYLRSLSEPSKCALWPCRRYECRLNRNEDNQPRCLEIHPRKVVNAVSEVIEMASRPQ